MSNTPASSSSTSKTAHQVFDTDGRRLTPADIDKNLRTHILAGAIGAIWVAVNVNTALPLFLEAIGASGFIIGLLTTFRMFALTAQVPITLYTERFEHRKPTVIKLALTQRLMWILISLAAFIYKPEYTWIPFFILGIAFVADIIGNGSASLWWAWSGDVVPEKSAGSFWGKRQAIQTLTTLLGTAGCGVLLDFFRNPSTNESSVHGFGIALGLGTCFGVVEIFVLRRVREPKPEVKREKTAPLERFLLPFKRADFRLNLVAVGLWHFAVVMMLTFSVIYFKRNFPTTYTHFAIWSILGSLGGVLTSRYIGALADHFGPRLMAAVIILLIPVASFGWFLVQPGVAEITLPLIGTFTLPKVFIVQCFFGPLLSILIIGFNPCLIRLLYLLSPPSQRSMAIANSWACIGIFSGLGALTGGFIMDYFTKHPIAYILPNGLPFSFYHVIVLLGAVILWFGSLPVLLRVNVPKEKMAFSNAITSLFTANPFTSMQNFRALRTLVAPVSSHKRADAARKLGENRSEIAIPELASQLDDPSFTVQEEAIEALGQIGTPEAVSMLSQKLSDPSGDLIPQVAKALRKANAQGCAESLIRVLENSHLDRESLTEVARTLGALGDRRAIPALLSLIARSHNNKVLATCSESLANLGEVSAVYQIIPQMRAATSRTLKRALSVAAGDLLGRKGVFYQMLLQEIESPGDQISKVTEKLKGRIRKLFPHAHAQIEALDKFESTYLEGRFGEAVPILLHLSIHLIQFRQRLPIILDDYNVTQKLLERDHQAATGLWYLNILNEPWPQGTEADTRERGDILLGLHFLASYLAKE